MWLERQDRDIVNLDNVFSIDICTWYDDAYYVGAFSPGTDGEVDRVLERVIYTGQKWQCEAYLRWLKKQLLARNEIIGHGFVCPLQKPEPEVALDEPDTD